MSNDRTNRAPAPRPRRRETVASVSGGLDLEAAIAEITAKLERSRTRVAEYKRQISILEEIAASRQR